MIKLLNEDCMAVMARYPDKYFDLAVVDPPYGIDINMNMGRRKGQKAEHTVKSWDKGIPDQAYFDELFRVSKNQIIWGGNYFPLPLVQGWLFWDKGVPDGVSFSDGELAWTSFDCALKICKIKYTGFQRFDKSSKIHPTQKPVQLYDWIYRNRGGRDMKIIDTHLGSGSSAISAELFGISEFVGCEIDKEYFDKAVKRHKEVTSQTQLFP